MEGTPSDSGANSTFTFDPTNMVVGVIDNADATKHALRDLIADGFSEKEIALLTDEEAARRSGVSTSGVKYQFISFAQRKNCQLSMTRP